MSINFANYLPYDLYKEMMYTDSTEKFLELESEYFQRLRPAFKELRDQGVFKEVVYSDIHNTNFAVDWNHFIHHKEDELEDDVWAYFFENIGRGSHKSFSLKDKTEEEKELIVKDLYDKMIKDCNQGNFKLFFNDGNECFCCGQRIFPVFENFNVTFYKKVNSGEYKTFNGRQWPVFKSVLADTCFNENIIDHTIELKTGHLIIGDWIKLDEFTQQVELNGNIYAWGSSLKDKKAQFEHYLQHNVISLRMSASKTLWTPSDDQDCLLFGTLVNGNDESEMQEGFIKNQSFDHDYRGLTIIEKEQLIEIINKTHNDLEKSTTVVENYLKNNSHECIEYQVEPGTYRLMYSLKKEDLDDKYFPTKMTEAMKPQVFFYKKERSPTLSHTQYKP